MLDNKVLGCSMPAHRATRGFRDRARAADIVVFATVEESPAQLSQRIVQRYYSAKLSVHCILKGPEIPKSIVVSGFGNDGGGCTTTDAVQHRSYVFLLRKSSDSYVLHKIDIARAAKPARERLLLKLLPEFWQKAHRPFSAGSKRNKTFNHCPSFKRMKRILRKSMRKFIRSKPKLSLKKQQLKKWLKMQRKLRKALKNALKREEMAISTTLGNNVELKANKHINEQDSLGVTRKRTGLFKRSNAQINTNKANYRKALSSGKASSSSNLCTMIFFAWLAMIIASRLAHTALLSSYG
eukprot:gene16893-18599_t